MSTVEGAQYIEGEFMNTQGAYSSKYWGYVDYT